MTAVVVVQSAVLLVLCVLVAGLLRAYADVLRRLHALDAGGDSGAAPAAPAPPPFRTVEGLPAPPASPVPGRAEWAAAVDLAGESLDGEIVHVRTVDVPHDTVLVFLSSGCAGCVGFWDELGTPGAWSLPAGARLVVVTKDAAQESPAVLSAMRPRGVDVVMSSAAWVDHAVPGSPYVVVVDGQTGRVKGEGSGSSFRQMMGLVQQAVGDGQARVRKPAGDAQREADVDAVLRAAGIGPGHPSLYEPAPTEAGAR